MKTDPVKRKLSKGMKITAALILIAAVLLSGCVEEGQNDTDTEPGGPTTDSNGGGDGNEMPEEYTYGTANVENIQIMILESFPVQVKVVVEGYLPDGCTEIDKIETEREGNTFNVSISTKRPKDAICTQALRPFAITIPLDVYGLKAGTYTVDVNGVTGTFELATDNIIEDSSPETDGNTSFTEADNGTTATLENGTIFYLKLSENPTTGYSWELELSPGLTLLKDEYIQDEPPEGVEQPLVGAGGVHLWEIKAEATGSQQVKGIYKRPWEEETGKEDNFTLNIEVV
ncbi:protease inhibitor I42 family protein [Methanosarcina sp. KYL-1]|uniref:protease inhibitor I42 family protein n=1 Tax=Methanosarcina sp. KYL-1 TaxID=2602068 RepID=UPI002101AC92|nr:protease inhibitor I42 family protein [Methanosarcina sp. KYL-1]MCQ1536459.1 protease inhibitor I42 family protein [Methanosarcina sp. KYL-1]